MDSPGAHFIATGREEIDQMQRVVPGANDLGNHRGDSALLQVCFALDGGHWRQLGFEADGEGDDGGTVARLDPLGDLGQPGMGGRRVRDGW